MLLKVRIVDTIVGREAKWEGIMRGVSGMLLMDYFLTWVLVHMCVQFVKMY